MTAPVVHTEVRVDPLADPVVHTEAVPGIVRRPAAATTQRSASQTAYATRRLSCCSYWNNQRGSCGNKAFLSEDMTDNALGQMSVIRLFSGKQAEKITYRLDTYLLL